MSPFDPSDPDGAAAERSTARTRGSGPGAAATKPTTKPAPASTARVADDVPAADAVRAVDGDGPVAGTRPGTGRDLPDDEGGVLGRTYRALSVGIVSVVLLIAFEATAVGTAMPVAARELDGVSLYAFAFSGYFTTSLFGMVLSGQWADRRGPLGPLATGIVAFGAGLALSGTAGAMWLFILGRAVQGLGGGLVIVALYVVVSRAYPERLRPSIMAAFAASWVIPSVVGPLVSGLVTEHLGWRWVFLGIPALVLVPLALALPQIRSRASGPAEAAPESAPDPAPVPAPDPASVSVAVTAAVAVAGKGPDTDRSDADRTDADRTKGRTSGRVPGRTAGRTKGRGRTERWAGGGRGVVPGRRIRLAFGISLGAGLLQYAAQDLRWLSLIPGVLGAALLVPAALGLLPRGTYRAARGLPSVVLLRGVAAGSFIAAESFVPLMLVTQRGLSPMMAGLSLAVGGATWALGSFVQSRPRVVPYRHRLMSFGMALVAASIATAPTVLIESVPVWIVAVAWAFGCFGMGLVISSTSVLLLELSAPHEAGSNSAALQMSDGLSNVMLLAIGGAAFAALGGGQIGAGHGAAATSQAAAGANAGAFVAVFVPMAVVAVVGVWVATRIRTSKPA
ncbi:MFS transporter [Streptomyces uncialis]|uniref:MFS transporter n=1 Tax=Streptomyces uncialis TaxID=1048205 RepID=UPI00379209BA